MAGHAQLKFVLTECSKTQIRLTGLISCFNIRGLLVLNVAFPERDILSVVFKSYLNFISKYIKVI